jgi:hypothetical protein
MLYKHGVFCRINNVPHIQHHFIKFAHYPVFKKTKTEHWMMDKIQKLKGAKYYYQCHNPTQMNVPPIV